MMNKDTSYDKKEVSEKIDDFYDNAVKPFMNFHGIRNYLIFCDHAEFLGLSAHTGLTSNFVTKTPSIELMASLIKILGDTRTRLLDTLVKEVKDPEVVKFLLAGLDITTDVFFTDKSTPQNI